MKPFVVVIFTMVQDHVVEILVMRKCGMVI